MDLSPYVERVARTEHRADDLARVGLGLVILLAGVHKLVDPGAWAVYVRTWIEPYLLLSPREFMLLNGVLEPPFAIALLADRYTTFAAAFVALSLVGTVAYLSTVAVTEGRFVDVIVRDIGLIALAGSVTIRAASRRS